MNRQKFIRTFLLVVFLISSVSVFSMDGWVVTVKTQSEQENSRSVIYLQDNIIKIVGEDGTFILDGNTRDLTFINEQEKTYWMGNMDNFKKRMQEFSSKAMDQYSVQMEEMMKNLTPEQRKMMEQTMKNNPMMPKKDEPKAKPPHVEIVRTGETESIIGKPTRKYIVKSDGEKMEAIWLAENIISPKDWNPKIFKELVESMSMGAVSTDYDDTDKYWDLQMKGMPLRTIYFYEDYQTVEEVEELTEKNLDKKIFQVPAGYKKVELDNYLK